MKKNALILAITIATLAIPTMALAFDFQELDSKISNGEITRDQAREIVDTAREKGEITRDQIRQHMEKMRGNSQGMRPFGPPPDFERKMPGKDDFMKKLKDAGITKKQMDTAHKKGPEAVRELLESHGIQPPKPPERHDKAEFRKN